LTREREEEQFKGEMAASGITDTDEFRINQELTKLKYTEESKDDQ
jgi:hypothetical protein